MISLLCIQTPIVLTHTQVLDYPPSQVHVLTNRRVYGDGLRLPGVFVITPSRVIVKPPTQTIKGIYTSVIKCR